MFKKVSLFLNFFIYLILLTIIIILIVSLVQLSFDLISCRFPYLFSQDDFFYTEWDFLNNFYYLLKFLDYDSIILSEIVDSELEKQDFLTYEAVFFVSCLYDCLVESLNSRVYEFLNLKHSQIPFDYVLNLMELDFNLELSSTLANYVDIIYLDKEHGLDKYFVNLKTEGWYKDCWEIKGPQVEYLKALAADQYFNREYFTTATNFGMDFEKIKVLRALRKMKPEEDHDIKLMYTFLPTFYLRFLELITDPIIALKNYCRYGSTEGLYYRSHNFVKGVWAVSEAVSLFDHSNFSMFYKIIKHTDRFFLDGFYVYFYIEKFGIMFRINRYVLAEIFPKNVVWGLLDNIKYPFSFSWNYNVYGLYDYHWKYLLEAGPKGFFPFERLKKGTDLYIYGREWLNLRKITNPFKRAFYNLNFEWYTNFTEIYPGWGRIYKGGDFYRSSYGNIISTDGPELSIDPFVYDKYFAEHDREEMNSVRYERMRLKAFAKKRHLRSLYWRVVRHVKPKLDKSAKNEPFGDIVEIVKISED